MKQTSIHRINPYIRVAMPSILQAGTYVKQRIIYDYELIYLEKGTLTLVYDGESNNCTPGQFIFIRPGVPHIFTNMKEKVSQPHIHFDMIYNSKSEITPISFKDRWAMSRDELSLLTDDLFSDYPQNPKITFNNEKSAKELFFSVIKSFQNKNELAAKGFLTALIEELVRSNYPTALNKETEMRYGIAEQVKDYIDSGQNYAVSLKALEEQFTYSRFYLEKQFSKTFGVSLIAYRNEKRLNAAKELLKTKSVYDTAETLGFTSIYSFSRAFKNKFGCPPSFYKPSIKEKDRKNV